MIPTLPLRHLSSERLNKTRLSIHQPIVADERVETSLPAEDIVALAISQAFEQARALELSRQTLQDALLQDAVLRQFFIEQLQQHIQQGVDVCELWWTQAQETDEWMPTAPSTHQADLPVAIVDTLHFFPSFLLHVASFALSAQSKLSKTITQPLRPALIQLQQQRQQMIDAHLGLVGFIARKYKTNQLSFEDIMQEGVIGLIKAVDRFDYRRNIRFSTYAAYWIKQAVNRLIIKQDKIIRLPVALAEKAPIVFALMRENYLQYQRWPTLAELKQQSGLSDDELKTISSYYQATHQLDPMTEDDEEDGLSLLTRLSQKQFALPLDELIAQNLVQFLNKALDSLPDKEATILMMRFGLKNHREMTLQAVADQLHVTRERVRQIQNEALHKLKQQFGFDLMPFLESND